MDAVLHWHAPCHCFNSTLRSCLIGTALREVCQSSTIAGCFPTLAQGFSHLLLSCSKALLSDFVLLWLLHTLCPNFQGPKPAYIHVCAFPKSFASPELKTSHDFSFHGRSARSLHSYLSIAKVCRSSMNVQVLPDLMVRWMSCWHACTCISALRRTS